MNDVFARRAPLLNGWRIAGWGSLLALLALPALVMQITGAVKWTASDFIFAAIMLGLVGTMAEFAVRFARPGAPRIGYVVAGLTAFFTVWSNAAVGIIGDEDSVNAFFYLMVLGAMAAAIVVRFRPAAMRSIAMLLAIGQYAVGIAALNMMPGHAVEWGFLTIFALLWLTAAWCFHHALIARTS
ncbi:hypothetical protein [Sphingopyxis kveilinensis]|uniref:hypothetical protein n=1 Tax=Sphingopyxis kveilinensis TaxID=3114367 RepID=UPI0030CF3D28